MEKCLAEGPYAVSYSYGDTRSQPVTQVAVYAPSSIDPLLSILDNAGNDLWVRKEALQWLRSLIPDFEYDFRKSDSGTFRVWWSGNRAPSGP